MPGPLIHLSALLACPHLGAVKPPTPLPRVLINGTLAVLNIADIHAIAGCTFQIPVPGGTKPQPCVRVQVEAATRVFVNGLPAAILTPAAICFTIEGIPQGPPNSGGIQPRAIAT